MLNDFFSSPIALLAVLLLGAVLVAALRRLVARGEGRLPYYSRQFLLSRGEMAFYRVLTRALPPGLVICPKVRLADLIGCSGDAWRAGYGGRIAGKHVDFVLADAGTLGIRLVIELDDRSHQRSDRRDRDMFVDCALDAAGIPILRVPAAAKYDVRHLTEHLEEAVAVADASRESGRA
jgi:hypothetical protein